MSTKPSKKIIEETVDSLIQELSLNPIRSVAAGVKGGLDSFKNAGQGLVGNFRVGGVASQIDQFAKKTQNQWEINREKAEKSASKMARSGNSSVAQTGEYANQMISAIDQSVKHLTATAKKVMPRSVGDFRPQPQPEQQQPEQPQPAPEPPKKKSKSEIKQLAKAVAKQMAKKQKKYDVDDIVKIMMKKISDMKQPEEQQPKQSQQPEQQPKRRLERVANVNQQKVQSGEVPQKQPARQEKASLSEPVKEFSELGLNDQQAQLVINALRANDTNAKAMSNAMNFGDRDEALRYFAKLQRNTQEVPRTQAAIPARLSSSTPTSASRRQKKPQGRSTNIGTEKTMMAKKGPFKTENINSMEDLMSSLLDETVASLSKKKNS